MDRTVFTDDGFYRSKKGSYERVEAPAWALSRAFPLADSHTHLQCLVDPENALRRSRVYNIGFICNVVDPTDDGEEPLARFANLENPPSGEDVEVASGGPCVVFAVGVHPHNARLYTPEIALRMRELWDRPDVTCVGEIGLDYYYDLSPREIQRRVFAEQLAAARTLGMPASLHLRDTAKSDVTEPSAHEEALAIVREVGAPEAGLILHCCSLAPAELEPWLELDCHVAYGGALTFASAESAREGALLVPEDRLLIETDAPYMAPVPMRGMACEPAHAIFTLDQLMELRGVADEAARKAFAQKIFDNTVGLLGCRDRRGSCNRHDDCETKGNR